MSRTIVGCHRVIFCRKEVLIKTATVESDRGKIFSSQSTKHCLEFRYDAGDVDYVDYTCHDFIEEHKHFATGKQKHFLKI